MKNNQIFPLMTACVALFFLATACNNTTSTTANKNNSSNLDTTGLRKIIDEKNNKFTQAHIDGDTAFLNNIFTQDGRVFAPNSEVVSGRSAIAAINLAYINFGIKEFREETTALYGSGNYLINEGNYFMSYSSTIEKGKFINIWKKVDDDWKLYANIWNSSLPLTPTK